MKQYWIIESRGNKKAWKPRYVHADLGAAKMSVARLKRFSKRWRESREYRIVPAREVE